MGRATTKMFLSRAPGEGSKGQISLNFNYKVNLKDFYTKLVCVLTNERYKTYQMRFSFCRLGHALGVGLGVLRGPKLNSVRRADHIMLSPPKPFDQIQPNLVCVCNSHAWDVQRQNFFGPAPLGAGQKVK